MPRMTTPDGTALHYRESGSGAPLVLLHGFPFSSALWRPQLAELRDSFRVIAPDLPGFGGSPLPAGSYTMARLADDVAGLLDRLELEAVALGGLSMGGYVAFEFYRRHRERLLALILADTRAEPDTPDAKEDRARAAERARAEGTAGILREMIPKLLAEKTRRERPDIVAELQEIMSEAMPEAVAAALEAMAAREDARPLLPELEAPTLVVVGGEDAITPPAAARAMADPIPNVRVEIIEDAGHVSSLEAPDRFSRVVRDFLVGIA